MVLTKIRRTKQGKTFAYLTAYIRDRFDLQDGDDIDVDFKGGKIILTPKKKEKKKK